MDESYKIKLWEKYEKNKTKEIKEQIILEYINLVKYVAGRLNIHFCHTVEYDDLVSYGVFGLIDAIDKFDYKKGVKFETYASLRIKGAILDQIRKLDWVPRTVRQKQKKIDNIYNELENKLGREATDYEMANALEITVDEYQEWTSQVNMLNIISLDEYTEQSKEKLDNSIINKRFNEPDKIYEKQELKTILINAIENLNDKEKQVIILYYYEELTLKEISYILNVSESRISQIHTKAIQKMKQKLGTNIEVFRMN